jgi:hypothetical protein
MKNQKLKQLLNEKMESQEMQPHDGITFLNRDEINQIGGTNCGVNHCIQNAPGLGCGVNSCTLN